MFVIIKDCLFGIKSVIEDNVFSRYYKSVFRFHILIEEELAHDF